MIYVHQPKTIDGMNLATVRKYARDLSVAYRELRREYESTMEYRLTKRIEELEARMPFVEE